MATNARVTAVPASVEKLATRLSGDLLNDLLPIELPTINIAEMQDPNMLLKNGKQHLEEAASILENPENQLSPGDIVDYARIRDNLRAREEILEKKINQRIRNPFLRFLPSRTRIVPLLQRFLTESLALHKNVSQKSRTAIMEKRARNKEQLVEFYNELLGKRQSTPSIAPSVATTSDTDAVQNLVQRLIDQDEESWRRGREDALKMGLKLCEYCGTQRDPHDVQYVQLRAESLELEPVCYDFCALVLDLPKLFPAEVVDRIRKVLHNDDLFAVIQNAIVCYHYNEVDPPPRLLVNIMFYRDKVSNIVDSLTTLLMHPKVFSEDAYRSIRSSLRRLLSKCIKVYYKSTGEYIYPEQYVFDPIRWSIAKRLPEAGEGSHGTVYVVNYINDPRWKRMIAVKVPKLRVKDKRMVYEFLVQWSLNHPNILQLYGTAKFIQDSDEYMPQDSPRHSLLMPLKTNGSTRDYIARKFKAGNLQNHQQMSVFKSRVHKWIIGVVTGLAYLHSEKIVHGDLRGYNIIVDDDEENTLLTDFGLSVFADGMSGNHDSKRYGNYLWQPLEILRGQDKVRPTTSTDVYFLGGVVIELYTGHDPYYLGHGNSDDDRDSEYPSQLKVIEWLKQNPPKYPDRPKFHSEDSADIMHDELWNFMQDCWKIKPNQRPSVEQLLERIPEVIRRVESS